VCGSRFFYYIKQEKFEELKNEIRTVMVELDKADKNQIEKDIRELTGLDEEPDKPVILDLESIKVVRPGKFEIDIVNLFSRNRPVIYKLGEGKYVIDINASFQKGANTSEVHIQSRTLELDDAEDMDEDEDDDSSDELDDESGDDGDDEESDEGEGK
jgi:predicted  nucleic acid-binding Zn-ribbon protein